MSLQGDIGDFTLLDIVRLMQFSERTGAVQFVDHEVRASSRSDGSAEARSPQSRSGVLYFREGAPIACECGGQRGEEALLSLCTWSTGTFVYTAASQPGEENLRADGVALAKVESTIQEWAELREQIPSDAAVFRQSTELPAGEQYATLSREEWRVLAEVDGRRPVAEVVEHLGGDPLAVHRIFVRLVKSGLVTLTG